MKRAGIGFILVTVLIDVLGFGMLIPILPQLITQLSHAGVSVGSRDYGLLIAIYSAMQFLFAPVLGAMSDRWGRRPVLLVSLFCSGIDYLIMAVAPTVGWLFLGRLISGITGANFTAASAYIADVSPPEKRAQSFGAIGAAFGVGFIIGPAIGGVLGTLGPRVPFIGSAVLALINWLYGLFILPESLPRDQRREFSWRRASPMGALGEIARYPLVLSLTGTYIFMALAGQALQCTWVLYTIERYHWSPAQNGLSLAAFGLMSIVSQAVLMPFALPRLGERRAIILGMIVNAVSSLAYGLATRGWMMYPIIVLASLGFIVGPAIQGLVSKRYASNEQGTIQGALTSLNSLTGIVAPVLFTMVFSFFVGPRAPVYLPGVAFFLSALLNLAALLLAIRAFRVTPETSTPTLLGSRTYTVE